MCRNPSQERTPTAPTIPPSPESAAGAVTADDNWTRDTQLTVIAWRDAYTECTLGAIPTASDDMLRWFTPIVGTVGTAVAHRLAGYAACGPSVWTLKDLGRTFGIEPTPSRIRRILDRLQRYDLARRDHTNLAVRLWLPPLSRRQRNLLPAYLRAAYTSHHDSVLAALRDTERAQLPPATAGLVRLIKNRLADQLDRQEPIDRGQLADLIHLLDALDT